MGGSYHGPAYALTALLLSACGSAHEASQDASGADDASASDSSSAKSTDAGCTQCADAAACPASATTVASVADYVAKLAHGIEFDALTPAQVDAAGAAARAVVDGDADAIAKAAAIGYSVGALRTPTECLALLTPTTAPKGQGTLVVRMSGWARDWVIEAPHIPFDGNTDAEAALLFDALGARALLLAGAQRCASTAASGCHANAQCPAKIALTSDPSHSVDTAFHGMHVALAASGKTSALQLHANLDPTSNGDILVSNGSHGASALVTSLVAALAAQKADARSCSDPKIATTALCGTTNAQALASNGATNACTGASGKVSDRFLHLEQYSRRLDDPRGWSSLVGAALVDVIPPR